MIEFEQFGLATPPGTQGSVIYNALRGCGLEPASPPTRNLARHIVIPPEKNADKIWISLVRDPVDWLCQAFHINPNLYDLLPVPVVELLSVTQRSLSLPDFMNEYLAMCPGVLKRISDAYPATSVLRVEDLPWNLIEFLEMIGVENSKMEELQLNPSKFKDKLDPKIDSSLRERITEAESEFCEEFDYL